MLTDCIKKECGDKLNHEYKKEILDKLNHLTDQLKKQNDHYNNDSFKSKDFETQIITLTTNISRFYKNLKLTSLPNHPDKTLVQICDCNCCHKEHNKLLKEFLEFYLSLQNYTSDNPNPIKKKLLVDLTRDILYEEIIRNLLHFNRRIMNEKLYDKKPCKVIKYDSENRTKMDDQTYSIYIKILEAIHKYNPKYKLSEALVNLCTYLNNSQCDPKICRRDNKSNKCKAKHKSMIFKMQNTQKSLIINTQKSLNINTQKIFNRSKFIFFNNKLAEKFYQSLKSEEKHFDVDTIDKLISPFNRLQYQKINNGSNLIAEYKHELSTKNFNDSIWRKIEHTLKTLFSDKVGSSRKKMKSIKKRKKRNVKKYKISLKKKKIKSGGQNKNTQIGYKTYQRVKSLKMKQNKNKYYIKQKNTNKK